MGARQRSGEGVVRGNGCPKGVVESPFLLCFLKVFRTFQVFQEQTLRGQRRNGLSKNTLLDNRFPARRLLRSFWRALTKASHIKASQPHFQHFLRFGVCIFRVFRIFVLLNLLRPFFSWGGRDVRIFRIFPVSGLNRRFENPTDRL